MKIMIMYPTIHDFDLFKVKGGAEAVALNYAKVLSNKHEVFLFTSKHEKIYETSFNIISSNLLSKSCSDLSSAKYNDFLFLEIKKYVLEHGIELIINHDAITKKKINFLNDLDIPCIHFFHNCAVGGIYNFNDSNNFKNIKKSKNSIYFVSNYQKEHWKNWIIKNTSYEEFYDGIIYNQVVNNLPEISEKTEDYYCIIARCHPCKNIHRLLKLHDNIQIFTTSESIKDFKEYWEKCQKNIKETHIINLDFEHNQIMNILSSSKGLLLSSEESSSFVAIEANSMGVPVHLFWNKSDHAVIEMCKNINFSKSFKDYGLKDSVQNLNLSYEERKELSQRARNFYNYENLEKRLNEVIKVSINKFNQHKENNLLEFI